MALGGGVEVRDVDADIVDRFESCTEVSPARYLRKSAIERTTVVIANALMVVQSRDPDRRRLQAVVDHPQRCSRGIAHTGLAVSEEGVCLAKDEGNTGLACVDSRDGVSRNVAPDVRLVSEVASDAGPHRFRAIRPVLVGLVMVLGDCVDGAARE